MTTLPLFSLLEEEGPVPLLAAELTSPQREAVERRDGSLFVHAGAGSGKTRVLVERFARAVIDDGVAVERILAITFTEKAAAELRGRIRSRFLEAGEREHARAVDSAWISTIHGFCSRLLRANALGAGIDPEFRVLAEHEAERVAANAFDAALEAFLAEDEGARRVDIVAAHGPDRIAAAIRAVHAQLRGRGLREPTLPQPSAPSREQMRTARSTLARCVRAARASLGEDVDSAAQVAAAARCLDRCAGALERAERDGVLDPLELRGMAVRRGNARALRGVAFDELEKAHAGCLELCARARAVADLALLGELLRLYGGRYRQLKTERSALDFDDLELLARDLLADRLALRERTRGRFDHVLVDELQDTNGLQSEILDLIAEDNLFTVGDDLQSIYGFRGAEVSVFAERAQAAAASGRELRLSSNFRARPEILDAINAAFAPVFGTGFAPLSPPGPGEGGARVEVLAVDRDSGRWSDVLASQAEPFGAAMHGAPPWRAAEARLLARRVDELLANGEFAPADVAVLVRSWTDVDRYEQALSELGVPTYVAGGGGYWSAQQVGDLRAYLAVLANPRDEMSLLSVLASPLAGVSLDALALVRLVAGRGGGLWAVLEAAFGADADPAHPLPAALPPADAERLREFVGRLAGERREAPRRSLPDLVERAVTASGYDRAVLTLPGGERRLANLRKLKRLAREFEATEGRDLRGFLDEIDRRGTIAAREGEAPIEGEGIDAVRLMTIHAAKGLEFPLVCVGDLGRGEPKETPILRVSAEGRVGLRLPDPDGGALDALDAQALAEEAARAEREEERRLLWVAATRAGQRLIVSGALDLEQARTAGPAMEWLAPALVPELREAHAGGESEGTCVREWEGREARIAWRILAPGNLGQTLPPEDRTPLETGPAAGPSTTPASSEPGRPASSAPLPGSPAARRDRSPVIRPLEPLTRISYSALESYRRCAYRFYLERGLRLPAYGEPARAASANDCGTSAPARVRGSVAHELLERIDPRRPLVPRAEQVVARLRARGADAHGREVEELVALIGGFLDSGLGARMKRALKVRRELPFAFGLQSGEGPSVVVEGVIDAHCREGSNALVIDYKTDRVGPDADLPALCEQAYATQRLVYALAALRAGAEHVEVAHVFLERPDEPVLVGYEASETAELEARLGVLVHALAAGRHEPSAAPGADLCRGCPGRAALCSWPPERTGGPVATG